MKINSKLFDQISFFLSGITKVENLNVGAVQFGGATALHDGIYSNIQKDNFITINKSNNQLSVFIPSTISADKQVNNSYFIKKYYDIIEANYNGTITALKTNGSWYSEDMNKVIIENITILSLNIKNVTQKDITFFLELGKQVKREMSQEAVSVTINTCLALV